MELCCYYQIVSLFNLMQSVYMYLPIFQHFLRLVCQELAEDTSVVSVRNILLD